MSNFTVKQIKAVLSANGLPTENLDAAANEICSRHKTSLDAIIEERDGFKEKASQYDDVKKELDGLKANPTDDWKEKHDKVKKDFDDYKNGITAEKTLASKKNAIKGLIESTGIKDPAIVELIMLKTEYDKIELDGDKVKNADSFKDTITKNYANYVEKSSAEGAKVNNPPANTGRKMTREEIYKKDDKGRYILSTAERQKALANNPDAMKGR